MDWCRKIVTCLMLATLLVATSTPVKAARPGFGALRIGRIGGRQSPRVQNNRPNTGGWSGYHGTGRVNTANTQYTYQNRMRPSLAQEYPDYMSHLVNRGSNRNLAATPDFWRNVHTSHYYFPIRKPATEAPSSRNNYQGSSDLSYLYQVGRRPEREEPEKRNADEWANEMRRRVKAWRGFTDDNRSSAVGESTTAKVTTDSGQHVRRLSSRNNYQGSSHFSYVYEDGRRPEREEPEKRKADEWASEMIRMAKASRGITDDNRSSAVGESTTAKVTTDSGQHEKRLSTRNNYQGSSDLSYLYQAGRRPEREEPEKRNADEWASEMRRRVKAWRGFTGDNRSSAVGERTTAKVTTDSGQHEKRLLATITSADGKTVRYVYL